MHDLTSLHRDLLVVIAGLDDPSGQTIKNELIKYYGDDVATGNLYSNLDQLVSKGLVEKGSLDGRTNYYQLARRGTRVLEDRQAWERDQLHDRVPSAAPRGATSR